MASPPPSKPSLAYSGADATRSLRDDDIVIRASTVWDTRAPFHYYFVSHRRFSQTHAVMTMALENFSGGEFRSLDSSGLKAKLTSNSGRAALAWKWWVKSHDQSLLDEGGPTGAELAEAVRPMQRTLRHALLAAYVSVFDHYVVCWALNYLLARLENKEGWTTSERWLAHELSPRGHANCDCKNKKNLGRNPYGVHFPDTLRILKIVGVQNLVLKEPALSDTTGVTRVDAWTSLDYWRQFRNHVVHKGSFDTRGLAADTKVWADLVHVAAATTRIKGGNPLPAPDYLLPACFGTHYRLAAWLQKFLINVSHQRRGHYYSPGPKPAGPVHVPKRGRPKPMLLDGDHATSLRWVRQYDGPKPSPDNAHSV